jgi:hypothetical protein
VQGEDGSVQACEDAVQGEDGLLSGVRRGGHGYLRWGRGDPVINFALIVASLAG